MDGTVGTMIPIIPQILLGKCMAVIPTEAQGSRLRELVLCRAGVLTSIRL